MARDGGDLAHRTIHKHGVAAALPEQFAAVTLQVSDQITALHYAAATSRSLTTSRPRMDSSASARLVSNTNPIASFRFTLASARVAHDASALRDQSGA